MNYDTNSDPDGRSSEAVAYGWASRIMTVSLEMVVPGVLGYWLDTRLGTKAVFCLLGFAGGMTLGIWHLVQIGSKDAKKTRQTQKPKQTK